MELVNSNTGIAVGLVITLMGAATTFGVMWNKVNNAEKKHDEDKKDYNDHLRKLEQKIDEQNRKIDRILEILAESGLKKTE